MRSLTLKLVLAFGLVTLLAVSGVGLLARRAAVAELGTYVTRTGTTRADLFAPAFARYYIDNGGWDGIHEALIALVSTLNSGRGMMMGLGGGPRWQENAAQALGSVQYEIVLADQRGMVIAHSGELAELGQQLGEPELSAGVPVNIEQEQVGTVLILTVASELNEQLASQFQKSVSRSVLIAGVAVGALALIVAIVLSLQILAPLGKLTTAAGRIAGGDLSQRVDVRSSDEVGTLADTFNSMAASLEAQQYLRRHLMADIAHELRTPLSIIRGNLEALLDGVHPLTEENIASVLDEVLLLGRLTDDLRELALAEAGQLVLQREHIDLPDLIQRICAGLEPIMQERGIALSVSSPDGIPTVLADRQRLSQIFHNLLSNAMRHTPAGGQIRITANGDDDSAFVSVTVADTGSGIDPSDLPSIFDRFHRGDSARRREYGGTGLGLSIVKQFVEAHGGQIEVTSALGVGSTFVLTLPAAPDG